MYRIWISNIIRFSEFTKYRTLNTIRYWENKNTEYYIVSRKSEYQIQIVLFGLTIQIPNTKYRIVSKILQKTQHKSTFKYLNSIWGAKKNKTQYRILLGIEIIRIPNRTTICSNYSNSIQIPNYSSHPESHNIFPYAYV